MDAAHQISNEELVVSYNAFADRYNAEHQAAIEAGELAAKPHSSAEFIEKASGIRSRYVYIKDGILDPARMTPQIPLRAEGDLSDQAEIAVTAKKALAAANKRRDIGAVIVSCAYTQRYYPAIAIEVQEALGIKGLALTCWLPVRLQPSRSNEPMKWSPRGQPARVDHQSRTHLSK